MTRIANARLVEKYRRDDPAYYKRLRRDLDAFYRLPAETQERMRRLDRTLREQDSATQRHLWEVLDRFNAWLDRLPEEDRRRVEGASSREERLRIIKELREKEFIRGLPKKDREQLDGLSEEERAEKIAQLRADELQLRQSLNPKTNYPVRPSDLWIVQQQYLEKILKPTLSPAEKDELKQAEGQWPEYAKTLLRMVEKHQFKGPTRTDALPAEARAAMNRLFKAGEKKILHKQEGDFPRFGQEFMRLIRQHKHRLERPLGPSRLEDLPPLHQTFITEKLLPLLDNSEKEDLQKEDGKWPEYPAKLLELADKKKLEIPLLDFPGMNELAETMRSEVSELPEVPDRTLRDFFLVELTEKERADLRLSLDDPDSRDRVRQEYFKRYPKALKRLRNIDQKANSGKK